MISKHPELTIAKWRDRTIAWLVDFAIISVGVGTVYGIFYSFYSDIHPAFHSITSLVFFAYWIILESRTGQSLGKKVMNIKTTKLDGKTADLKDIVINSFGKAFLLPIDLIFGWIFTNSKKQRIFNRLSDTIVIKLDPTPQDDVSYKFD